MSPQPNRVCSWEQQEGALLWVTGGVVLRTRWIFLKLYWYRTYVKYNHWLTRFFLKLHWQLCNHYYNQLLNAVVNLKRNPASISNYSNLPSHGPTSVFVALCILDTSRAPNHGICIFKVHPCYSTHHFEYDNCKLDRTPQGIEWFIKARGELEWQCHFGHFVFEMLVIHLMESFIHVWRVVSHFLMSYIEVTFKWTSDLHRLK